MLTILQSRAADFPTSKVFSMTTRVRRVLSRFTKENKGKGYFDSSFVLEGFGCFYLSVMSPPV